MSTATKSKVPPSGSDGASPSQGPSPLELMGPFTRVPSLKEIERLTAIPDRRVVFRGVDWAFYDTLVESVPEGMNIHVDYDGKDLEVMANGPEHEGIADAFGDFVKVVAVEMGLTCKSLRETTWNRPRISRALQSDQCYYFDPEKLAQFERLRGRKDTSILPDLDLAIEVDISRPEVDRAGIHAALRVGEVWRFVNKKIIIERLTPAGTYVVVEASGVLPVRADEIQRWVVDEVRTDDAEWFRRLQAYFRKRAAKERKRRPNK